MRQLGLLPIAVICLCLPAVATGQERARPDPNSPAGVEYKIPLDQARDDAAGKRSGDAGEGKGPPLFGSGITEALPGSRASRGSRPAAHEPKPGDARDGRGRVAAAPATSEGGSGASVSLIAAAVLIVGGVLGLGMRRGMGRTSRP